MKGGDPRRKPSDHTWSPNDDALLKSFIDKYPYNWYLIAECFNASRVTISMDKRSPRDCLERWREKWGSELRLRQTEAGAASTEGITSPSTGQSQMTTRGVKRQAGASILSPTNGIAAPSAEPRKRRRHLLMQDTIRKYTKKRIETLQKANGEFIHIIGRKFTVYIAQRKPSIIHETHGQYAKLPKLSPAELIRLKVERDAREHQELLARKVIQARLSQQASLLPLSSGLPDRFRVLKYFSRNSRSRPRNNNRRSNSRERPSNNSWPRRVR
jgi:chromatin modification-related protein VID21